MTCVGGVVSRLGRCAPSHLNHRPPSSAASRTRWLRCERSEPRNQPTELREVESVTCWLASRLGRCAPLAPQPTTSVERSEPYSLVEVRAKRASKPAHRTARGGIRHLLVGFEARALRATRTSTNDLRRAQRAVLAG